MRKIIACLTVPIEFAKENLETVIDDFGPISITEDEKNALRDLVNTTKERYIFIVLEGGAKDDTADLLLFGDRFDHATTMMFAAMHSVQ